VSFAVTSTGLEIPGAARDRLTQDDVAARLLRKDATLWGPEAEDEAAVRLGWLDLPATSRELVGRLAELRAELAAEGLDRIVLCGMGGSSLAPEVICRTAGVPLVVLDTTDPGQVAAAMTDLARTVVVVSSKSGGTVETESQRRAFLTAFTDSGLDEKEAGARFVVVTDPASPLSETATAMSARAVFLADPTVGGRYSALSAFGLVPSALAGADVGALLDDAEELAEHLNAADHPALELAWRWAPPPRRAGTSSASPTATRPSPASATGPSSSSRSPPASGGAGSCPSSWSPRTRPARTPRTRCSPSSAGRPAPPARPSG
jgi:hypothetical protein